MIKEFLDSIQQRVVDAFSGLAEFVYLAEWYILGFVVLIVALVAGYFFNFPWVRAVLGFIVLAFGSFLAGLQVMANHAKKDNEEYRQRIKELQAEQRQKTTDRGWFS
jgi:hypothetical protein